MQDNATQFLDSLTEEEIRDRIDAIDRERKSLMTLLRAVRQRKPISTVDQEASQ